MRCWGVRAASVGCAENDKKELGFEQQLGLRQQG